MSCAACGIGRKTRIRRNERDFFQRDWSTMANKREKWKKRSLCPAVGSGHHRRNVWCADWPDEQRGDGGAAVGGGLDGDGAQLGAALAAPRAAAHHHAHRRERTLRHVQHLYTHKFDLGQCRPTYFVTMTSIAKYMASCDSFKDAPQPKFPDSNI